MGHGEWAREEGRGGVGAELWRGPGEHDAMGGSPCSFETARQASLELTMVTGRDAYSNAAAR